MSGSVEVEAIATVNKWSKKEEEAEEGEEGHRRDAEGLILCDVRDKLLEEPRFANYLSKDSDFQGTRKRERSRTNVRERELWQARLRKTRRLINVTCAHFSSWDILPGRVQLGGFFSLRSLGLRAKLRSSFVLSGTPTKDIRASFDFD